MRACTRTRSGLAHEQEMAAGGLHRLTERLAGIEVVAKIDRLEPGVGRAVLGQPAPRRPALAILFVVAVLRHHELRLKRHHLAVAGRDKRGTEQGVEVLGGLAWAGAG